MKLSKLLHDTGIKCEGTTDNRRDDPEISGICCDSRQVERGDLFLCLKGAKNDGGDFAEEAAVRGAAAVILRLADGKAPTAETAARLAGCLYGYPDRKLTLIGVTGTNGKTTTTWMVQRILQELGANCGLIGTVAYDAGERILSAERTTPQPDRLYRLLNEMTGKGLAACAMEVSSHGLALGRVDSLEFQYGAFTNLTEDHLDFHRTMEEYYQAKKHLFSLVKICGFINVDDPWGRRLYKELKGEGKRCRSVSLTDPDADIYGQIQSSSRQGSIVVIPRCGAKLPLALPGRFNCENGLMAWALAMAVTERKAADVLAKISGVPGRFEPVENRRGKTVIVDYAHTPDALERVLAAARPLLSEGGKLICVFGCGGDREKAKRPMMGRISGELADYTIITSDNPRTEDQKEIASQIETGMRQTAGAYEILHDRKEAIARALTLCGEKDMVIIAGKGHETTQTIGQQSYPFDDRKVAEELLKK